jgi:small subunit ribosomal protein S8
MEEIESYMRRYLPARDMGILIISTNKGLLTHKQAYEQNLGGVLIAYFY